jgi:hypothetical protein
MTSLFRLAEVLKPHPWDTLLAVGVLTTLALCPLAIKAGTMYEERRTRRLREKFGDEYDQAVDHFADRRRAEAALVAQLRREQGRTAHPIGSIIRMIPDAAARCISMARAAARSFRQRLRQIGGEHR